MSWRCTRILAQAPEALVTVPLSKCWIIDKTAGSSTSLTSVGYFDRRATIFYEMSKNAWLIWQSGVLALVQMKHWKSFRSQLSWHRPDSLGQVSLPQLSNICFEVASLKPSFLTFVLYCDWFDEVGNVSWYFPGHFMTLTGFSVTANLDDTVDPFRWQFQVAGKGKTCRSRTCSIQLSWQAWLCELRRQDSSGACHESVADLLNHGSWQAHGFLISRFVPGLETLSHRFFLHIRERCMDPQPSSPCCNGAWPVLLL